MEENNSELNEKTKKELEERRKSKDFVSHQEVKKYLKNKNFYKNRLY